MFCQPLGRHTRSRVTKLRHRFLHPDVDMDALANATAGVASFSGADIAGVVRDAASHAMSRAVDASAIGGRELASTVPAALQVRCWCVRVVATCNNVVNTSLCQVTPDDFYRAIRDVFGLSRPQLGPFDRVTSPLSHSAARHMVKQPLPSWHDKRPDVTPLSQANTLLDVPEISKVRTPCPRSLASQCPLTPHCTRRTPAFSLGHAHHRCALGRQGKCGSRPRLDIGATAWCRVGPRPHASARIHRRQRRADATSFWWRRWHRASGACHDDSSTRARRGSIWPDGCGDGACLRVRW